MSPEFSTDTGSALSAAEVEQNYSYRERYLEGREPRGFLETARPQYPPHIAAMSDQAVADLVSPAAHALIWKYEVDGPRGYETTYCHPCRPPDPSGITIGFGYDLGYYTQAEFAEAWKSQLPEADFTELSAAVGVTGQRAQALRPELKHISIPFAAAEHVYRHVCVPTEGRKTLKAFLGSEVLAGDCFGVLLSLIYNRGNSMKDTDGRREMRTIRDLIAAKRFAEIPNQLIVMKRQWGPDKSGLWKRREAEAALFAQGLVALDRAARVTPVVVAAAQPAALPAAVDADATGPASPVAATPLPRLESLRPTAPEYPEHHGEGDGKFWPDDDYSGEPTPRPPHRELEAADPWAGVTWAQDDDTSTEYRHILAADRGLREASFLFTADDLELLIRANHFAPDRKRGRIIFGLRGVVLDHDTTATEEGFAQIGRHSLRLKVTRPDHTNFRCVIGVLDLERGLLSGFIASTVPNRIAVLSYKLQGEAGNLLPCGAYRYRVGIHKQKYPGCLRQDEPFAVLRSRDNLIYDVKDAFDANVTDWPCDNIHPAFSDKNYSAEFSSWGCQTPRGRHDGETFTGEFAKFRVALGLAAPSLQEPDFKDRPTYTYVLLTGHEAAIAAKLRETKADTDGARVKESLVRLRQGSVGDEVRRLQAKLGIAISGVFDAVTKKALADRQRSLTTTCDGVYAPAWDKAWQWDVLGEAAANLARPQMVSLATSEAAATAGAKLESTRASALVGRDPLEAVLYELGRRSKLAQSEPELVGRASVPAYEAVTTQSWADTVALGRRTFARIEAAAQVLACGEGISDKAERDALRTALTGALRLESDEQSAEAVSRALMGALMIPATVARPAAEVMVVRLKRSVKANLAATATADCALCTAWAASGDPAQAVADDLIDQVAAASKGGTWMLLQRQIKDLYAAMTGRGVVLAPSAAARLVSALAHAGDTVPMVPALGADTGQLVEEVCQIVSAKTIDEKALRTKWDQLYQRLADPNTCTPPAGLLQLGDLHRLMKALRSARQFALLSKTADLTLVYYPDDALSRQFYGQALIDQGQMQAGIAILTPLEAGASFTPEERNEASGLIGRAHKQIYVNLVLPNATSAIRERFKPELQAAIDCYARGFDPSRPGAATWHGTHLVALLKLAEVDGQNVANPTGCPPDQIARAIIDSLEPQIGSTTDPWPLVTLAHAYLAIGWHEQAARYFGRFAAAADTFQLAGTIRQLEQVYRVNPVSQGAGPILAILKEAQVNDPVGSFTLDGDNLAKLKQNSGSEQHSHFRETMTPDGRFIPATKLRMVLDRAQAVAAIRNQSGSTVGTGFLLAGDDLHRDLRGKKFLLTNAHVLSDPANSATYYSDSAVTPQSARIVLEGAGGAPLECAKTVTWQSTQETHDACLIEVTGDLGTVAPLAVCEENLGLNPDIDADPKRGTLVSVVGYPLGGPLSFSSVGDIGGANGVLVDVGPRKHDDKEPIFIRYSAATEPGNSGSPVFETRNWSVIGLHHEGFDINLGVPRLAGKDGTSKANEGISIHSIRRAMAGDFKSPSGGRKR